MKLTAPQVQMLRRLVRRDHHHWRMPADGRKAQGWKRTLWALQKRGLVEWLHSPDSPVAGRDGITTQSTCPLCGIETTGPGWCITQAGVDLAQATGLLETP